MGKSEGDHLRFATFTSPDRRRCDHFVCEDRVTGAWLASLERHRKYITPAVKLQFMAECYARFPASPPIPGLLDSVD